MKTLAERMSIQNGCFRDTSGYDFFSTKYMGGFRVCSKSYHTP